MSPGAAGTVTAFSDTTQVVRGEGGADFAAMVGTVIPLGIPLTPTTCSHTDFACLIQARAAQQKLAAMKQNGPCTSQRTAGFLSL